MSVFKVDKNFEVILNREAVKLVPELANVTQQQLRYIILVVDYVDGPFRKKPPDERKLLARRQVYGDSKKITEPDSLRIKMEAYKSLVFDIRRETIDVFTQKVTALQKEVIQPEITFTRMKEIDQSISFMQDRITSINHELDIEEGEEIELKGQKKLSYVEIWQKNQKAYREYQSHE